MEEFKEKYKKPFYDLDEPRVDLPETFTIVSCPNCSTEIPADNLYVENQIGKCKSCAAMFSIEDDIKELRKSSHKIKQNVLRPAGIEMFQFQDQFEISFEPSFSWLEWIVFMLYCMISVIGIPMSIKFSNIYPLASLTILPTILLYYYVKRRKEKHRVILAIDNQQLSILWRPKKLHQDKAYNIEDIHQLFVKPRTDMAVWTIFMIVDEGQGQEHIKLASLTNGPQAKYLEQEIEAYLKIEDVHVPGEK